MRIAYTTSLMAVTEEWLAVERGESFGLLEHRGVHGLFVAHAPHTSSAGRECLELRRGRLGEAGPRRGGEGSCDAKASEAG